MNKLHLKVACTLERRSKEYFNHLARETQLSIATGAVSTVVHTIYYRAVKATNPPEIKITVDKPENTDYG